MCAQRLSVAVTHARRDTRRYPSVGPRDTRSVESAQNSASIASSQLDPGRARQWAATRRYTLTTTFNRCKPGNEIP